MGAPFRAIFSTVSVSNQLQFIWRGLINAVPSVVNRTDACPLSREKQRWRLGTDDVALRAVEMTVAIVPPPSSVIESQWMTR
jgi:hypothetical protein